MPNWLNGIVTWAKGNKAYAVAIVGGVLVMAWFLFVPGEDPQVVQQQQAEDRFGAGALPGDATTAKALTEMQVAVESLNYALSQQKEQHSRLLRDVETQKTRFNARFEEQERSYTEQLEAALKAAIEIARDTEQRQAAAPRLRILRPGGAEAAPVSAVPPPAPPAPASGPWVRLPIGSLVTGQLMTGAFATKVRGDALPVLVDLRSAYSGPNDTEIPLEGCLMIGKATADLTSVRARVEAVSLSCVLPDGTSFERAVRGYFTGEDGTLGVPGRWEFRSGRWLANLLSAMGTTAAGIYADVAIAKELGIAGAILGDVGTSETTTRIQEFFLKRAEEILPVVWIESQTPVYVVMLEGVTVEGLPAVAGWPSVASDFD